MTITGLRMWHELRGTPCIPLEDVPPSKKAICTSRSFGTMLKDPERISEAVSSFTAKCAKKLRSQKSCCKIITVFLHTNGFRRDLDQYSNSLSIDLPVASNSTLELTGYALKAFKTIFRSGYQYKKAGVMVTDIIPEHHVQTNLFYASDSLKQEKVMIALDKINNIYGMDKLRLGSQGYNSDWKLKNESLSPCYTTRMKDLINIKV